MTIRSYLTHILKLFGRQLVPNIGSVLIMTAMLFAYNAQAATLREPSGPANPNVSPTIISYQGTLFDSSGNPVTGNVGMTFRFYSALTGGTKLWEEAHTGANAVPINNGLFHVLLGGLTPIPTSVWSSASVYLGILIAGETTELSPREMVGAVPFAMQVSNIIVPDGSITEAKIVDGSVTFQKLNPHAIGKWTMLDNSITIVSLQNEPSFNWKILDLSENVPISAEMVYVKIYMQGTANAACSIGPYNSNGASIEVRSAVSSVWDAGSGLVKINSGKLQYQCNGNGSNVNFGIELWGYYEPGY